MGSKQAIITVTEKVQVTTERKVRDDLDHKLPKPLAVPDTENVKVTWGHEQNNMSVRQQHAAFFDQNDGGIIYPWETYRVYGCSQMRNPYCGAGRMICKSWSMSWIPSLFFPIYIQNIHKMKHGSDSGTYDTEGRYIPVNFENIFSKYARTVPDKLTRGELWHMTQSTRNAFDLFGWIVRKLERGILYILARDQQATYRKKLYVPALTEAHLNTVQKFIKVLLRSWTDS